MSAPWDRLAAVQLGVDTRRELYSVFGPGLVAIAELALFTVPEESASSPKGILQSLASATQGLSVGAGIFVGLFVLYLAFMLGRACRYLGWGMADFPRGRRFERMSAVRDALIRAYGEERVVSVLRKHPVWHVLDPAHDVDAPSYDANPTKGSYSPIKGSYRRDPEGKRRRPDFDTYRGHVLQYCKSWLRVRQPLLSVDGIEMEINVLYGFVPVILLGELFAVRWLWFMDHGPVLWSGYGGHLVLKVVFTALPLLFAYFALRAAGKQQEDECGLALRGLLFAEWFSDPSESSRSGRVEG
ncbi:MAG TPA: hypothetical protein VG318_17950 [Actinomycetota bacterium]|nr:hypothetical protein [Actinomycetota bacterium]